MKAVAEWSDEEPRLALLIADDDAGARARVTERVHASVEALAVLEAADGAEAIRIGLQRRPQIALLDVAMPRLGGIEAALALRQLRPQMRVALQTAEPLAHRRRAREHRLPLFDKLDLDRAIAWLELQARTWLELRSGRHAVATLSLECTACGYGVARQEPPARCPMCQRVGAWVYTPWRPFSREHQLIRYRVSAPRGTKTTRPG
jgi:CheY-like chemotaxis protein